jgi:hypothetical protein
MNSISEPDQPSLRRTKPKKLVVARDFDFFVRNDFQPFKLVDNNLHVFFPDNLEGLSRTLMASIISYFMNKGGYDIDNVGLNVCSEQAAYLYRVLHRSAYDRILGISDVHEAQPMRYWFEDKIRVAFTLLQGCNDYGLIVTPTVMYWKTVFDDFLSMMLDEIYFVIDLNIQHTTNRDNTMSDMSYHVRIEQIGFLSDNDYVLGQIALSQAPATTE